MLAVVLRYSAATGGKKRDHDSWWSKEIVKVLCVRETRNQFNAFVC